MPNSERILVLVKPDGVRRGLIGEVLSRIEAHGFLIEALDMRLATEELLAAHYAEHGDAPFYPALVTYMSSGPLVAMVARGARIIESFRIMAGATDPVKAAPGTIRGDFGRDWGDGDVIQNVVHGSDSRAAAEREIGLWFPQL